MSTALTPEDTRRVLSLSHAGGSAARIHTAERSQWRNLIRGGLVSILSSGPCWCLLGLTRLGARLSPHLDEASGIVTGAEQAELLLENIVLAGESDEDPPAHGISWDDITVSFRTPPSPSPPTFAERVDAELSAVRSVLIAKNAAYGNSALSPLRVFARGMSASQGLRVRIDDKLSRVARGDGRGNEDNTLDALGYLVLLRIAESDEQTLGPPGARPDLTTDVLL